MYNKEEYQSLILAALLHDIGKIGQRTKVELNEEDKKLMASCCPGYDGKHTHLHVLYSGRFIRETFNKKFPMVENILLYHHRYYSAPEDYRRLVKILTLSDWLSSGERREDEESGAGDASTEPLISVFSTLFLGPQKVEHKFIPLLPLSSDLTPLFPKENKADAIDKSLKHCLDEKRIATKYQNFSEIH